MAWKSLEELTAKIAEYDSAIEEIPESFEVADDYLIDGMTAADFAAGYKKYRNLMKQINTAIIAAPDSFGLTAPDKKGVIKVVEATFYPFLWAFTAMAVSGDVKDGVLYVNGAEFLVYATGKKAFGSHDAYPRNLSVVMDKLGDYGFAADGYIFGESADFTVKGDANLIRVIKAATLSQYRSKSMLSDYAHFNCLMYKYPAKDKMEFADTHTAKISADYVVEYVTTAIAEFAKLKHGIGSERHHKHTEGWLRFKFFQIYYGTDNVYTILEMKDITAHKDYLETLPEKYFNMASDGAKCRGCRKECGARFVGEMFGKKSAWCKLAPLRGFNEIDDLHMAVEIIKNTHLKSK